MSISIILPAYNEEEGVQHAIRAIPQNDLLQQGYVCEVIVVDNNSTDQTAAFARVLGARVVQETRQGYGLAHRAGIAQSSGNIIVAADADGSYPLKELPRLLAIFHDQDLDFLMTNRFKKTWRPSAMPVVNAIGNHLLTTVVKTFFRLPIQDSQSGMWIVRRSFMEQMKLYATGMAFSQEVKIECIYYLRGKWKEVAIGYQRRVGTKKLRLLRDGIGNLMFLVKKRIRR